MPITYEPFVYIILVNYMGWHHTVECLESLFRSDYRYFGVIVVDNGSGDDSVEALKYWAEGRLDLLSYRTNPMSTFSFPPISKPVSYTHLSPDERPSVDADKVSRLFIISSETNLGFAGANNLGIKLALSNNNCKWLWLLNNDTVVARDSLSQLVNEAEAAKHKGLHVGIWGSKLLYYHSPEIINAAGGKYHKWIGLSMQIGMMEIDRGQHDKSNTKMDYIIGASLFIDRDFLSHTGMMCEDYFLYYEELDWTLRGSQRGWSIGLCPKSVVYHKEGATIGSSKRSKSRTATTDYYAFRNRILFTRKFYPYCLFTVVASSIAAFFLRLLRGDISNLKAIAKGIIDGLGQIKGRVDYV